ncbi:MAG: bifunctional glutamate N-acetyltransferase/amino-acid acetyltransferase ArgJ [Actinomycetaceae bacterium]|nr:bifunctional glutamate N-acetyltransferase/amino-acid acetyltransferase ArgJ [Actinomycetaceae bacterium]MDY5854600.1 bifunctional glutamate N-acetyltransferase/amino-acid acetyltransferase ArgJ [Arcanobacterium sp.]
MITLIDGGVCAAAGFSAAGMHAGIRKNRSKRDLALLTSSVPAAAAAVYTRNLVQGAPIAVTKAHLAASGGYASAILCNSGNANTCNPGGEAVAQETCDALARELGIDTNAVVVASTGVIGEPLNAQPIVTAIPQLVSALDASTDAAHAAAEAILTTDTHAKEVAVSFELSGAHGPVRCSLGAMAKGSGMIHPDMATMLVFITSDVAISPQMLQQALSTDVRSSFNMTSVDGDTSTNDTVAILANGLAGNTPIEAEGADFNEFMKALNTVTMHLCKLIAGDGEGATKLLECAVEGAANEEAAKALAKSVITSSLVKTAMFGADANWGRVLCALGYAGVPVDPHGISVSFESAAGSITVCEQGVGVGFSEEKAKEILLEKEITIRVALSDGSASATAWGCDLTYDYVHINGDYRS